MKPHQIYLAVLMLTCWFTSSSQQIEYAEYFFNTDPGAGNGIPVSITSADSLDIVFSASTVSLGAGFHKIYVRFKDSNGVWSLYAGRMFHIQPEFETMPAAPITAVEYFYNTDPGVGNGDPISVTQADSVDILTSLPTAGLSEGFHKVYVRVMDTAEIWSLYTGRMFYIQPETVPTARITAAEYFFDTDPGPGNGIPATISSVDSLDLIISITLTGVDSGMHYIYFRFADTSGVWGISERDTVNVYPGLVLKVFLEGPFNGTEMNTDLNSDELPLTQPYNTSPWNYEGTEQAGSIPDPDIVDWVLVEMRETAAVPATASQDSVISRQATFLMKNGEIIIITGNNTLPDKSKSFDNLHVVIWHRNHLGVMSDAPLVETSGAYTYDFTDQLSKAYLDGQKEIAAGIYGMIAGNSDGNGIIDNDDKDQYWSLEAGKAGYYSSDMNLNTQVNNPDKADVWEINLDEKSRVPGINPFSCGDILVDWRDGHTYSTVLIGSQCWMAENLNIGTRIDGINDQTNDSIIEKYCHENLENNCDIYGGLYQWNEMMQYTTAQGAQGICTDGWHIPTDDEWKVLEGIVDSQYGVGDPEWDGVYLRGFDAGKNLKSTSGWNSGGNGTDLFGFTALPGAYRTTGGSFGNLGSITRFWSSTETSGPDTWCRILHSIYDETERWNISKQQFGHSVRCILDYTNQPPSEPSNPSPEDGSIDIGIDTTLSWTCTDPDGNDLFFNIYFGTDPNPPFVQGSLTDSSYSPGTLTINSTYYWMVVVYDSYGDSAVSNTWSFTTRSFACGDQLVDIRDGKSYGTVEIGTQCWMAENINIGTRIDGINDQTNNSIIEKYCYDDLESNCDIYGGLYQWNEMMEYSSMPGSQGICQPGWHIPTDDEWKILEGTVDSQYGVGDPVWDTTFWRGFDAGKNLKSTNGWLSGGNGTDLYGFSALLSGFWQDALPTNFRDLGFNSLFWLSTEYNINAAWERWLNSYKDGVSRGYAVKLSGFSIRCLSD